VRWQRGQRRQGQRRQGQRRQRQRPGRLDWPGRAAWRAIAVSALLVTVAALTAGPARAAGGGDSKPVPDQQLITVTATSHRATTAALAGYRWDGTRWVKVFGPWRARVGYHGIARRGAKREGDGRTPSGSYGFGFFFGVRRNPGLRFPFRHAYSYDVWDDDPASPRYNEWVDDRHADPGARPEPMHQVPAYNYAAVIAYNTARVPGLGSAIFLHVGTGGATAGCVSLPERELLRVLRWLNPKRSPKITITVR
jgi:L,D-peptidoglycan transpeptidase YkuD (ErfK/YbiS/YcfS/YnhG family)